MSANMPIKQSPNWKYLETIRQDSWDISTSQRGQILELHNFHQHTRSYDHVWIPRMLVAESVMIMFIHKQNGWLFFLTYFSSKTDIAGKYSKPLSKSSNSKWVKFQLLPVELLIQRLGMLANVRDGLCCGLYPEIDDEILSSVSIYLLSSEIFWYQSKSNCPSIFVVVQTSFQMQA